MDDQIPTPQRRPRPPQNARRARPPQPPSRESRFIGYVVLGFGLLAVITVFILAFSGDDMPPVPQQIEVAQPQPVTKSGPPAEKSDPTQIMAELGITDKIQTPAPKTVQAPKLAFARQKNIPVDQIAGGWQAMIGQYTAVAQLDGKTYQIILAPPDPNEDRVYSSGTYQVRGDLITFTPQTHWPPPDPGINKNVSYSMLTRASFSVAAAFQKGYMYWQNAPDTEKQIYTTPKSPLFMTEKVNYVVWQRVGG